MPIRRLWPGIAGLLLAGCASQPSPPPLPAPVCPPCALQAPQPLPLAAKPLQPAAWQDLAGWSADDPRPALAAFLRSCRANGTKPAWTAVCDAAAGVAADDADGVRQFFQAHFRPYRLVNPDGSDEGLITGYFEPVIEASREPGPTFAEPIYGPPDDMLTIDLGELYPELKKFRLRGRLEGRRVVPYFDRAGIEARQSERHSTVLYWARDAVELFFLQVQGSGQLQLVDGSRVRVGYADQNGHPYRSIGRWLVEQGELKLEEASMQGIQAWARANPQRLRELLEVNPSYVFFRDLGRPEAPPPGAQGVALTDGRSLAVDPRAVPLGAPVWLATDQPNSDLPLQRLMVAQDTGGAIKGVVRADFFWGSGPEAGAQAGRMKQRGRMWVLLPVDYPVAE